MVTEIDPKQWKRAAAFELWRNAPQPMVTLFKTLDVTRLVKLSRRRGLKLNMLLCWCVGRAAARTEEFFTLPMGDTLMRYDRLAVSTVVALENGDVSTCDIPFSDSLKQFERDYLSLTGRVQASGEPYDLSGSHMVVGTSALAGYDIDGAVNVYAGVYNNPFLIWGKYRKKLWRSELPISFQFHHAQMDGVPAARFLDDLRREIGSLRM